MVLTVMGYIWLWDHWTPERRAATKWWKTLAAFNFFVILAGLFITGTGTYDLVLRFPLVNKIDRDVGGRHWHYTAV